MPLAFKNVLVSGLGSTKERTASMGHGSLNLAGRSGFPFSGLMNALSYIPLEVSTANFSLQEL